MIKIGDIKDIFQDLWDDFGNSISIDFIDKHLIKDIMFYNTFDNDKFNQKTNSFIVIKRRYGGAGKYLEYSDMLPYLEEIKDRLDDIFEVKISFDGKSGTLLNEFPSEKYFSVFDLDDISLYSIWFNIDVKTNERIKNFANFK